MISPYTFALVLLGGIFACLEIGRRIGRAALARDPGGATVGNGAIDTAVYGLLGLLLAFTFSGAATRFDGRRALMGEETNAIGTAYLRLDLLPPEARAPLQRKFRAYVDSRIATYENSADLPRALAQLARSEELRREIWADAVAATRSIDQVQRLVLPPINTMLDVSTTQIVAAYTHPPRIVYVMLAGLALVAALLAGYGIAPAKTRHWLHVVVFAVLLSSTAFVILDLEYPRFGLIRVDTADRPLIELRASMK